MVTGCTNSIESTYIAPLSKFSCSGLVIAGDNELISDLLKIPGYFEVGFPRS